jgi:cyclohexadienyl dehydratase
MHSTLHDLDAVGRAGVRISVNAGGHLERVARARFPRAQILRITPNDAVPLAIEAGKADAVLTDTLEAPHWQAKHPGLRRIGPLTQDRKAALVRAGDTATARALDDWLLRREADGALGQWRRAHLGQAAGGETATPLGALVAALDERLALMPDVARAKRLRGLPITDAAQEARVLDAASQAVNDAAAALHRPAPPDTAVRAFFEAQMALARALQEHPTHAAPAADEANGHAPPDLDLTLRPAIARISDRISVGLVALPPEVDAARAASALRTGIRSVTLDAAEIEAMARSIADCARR